MANDYIIKIEGSWPSGETEYVIGTEDPQRLPVVSSDDNGDVLTVVDGKWSDAAPGGGGGGGGSVVVTVGQDGKLNKKWQEIYDGLALGTLFAVVAEYAEEGYADRTIILLTYAEGTEGSYKVQDSPQGKEFVAACATADDYPAISAP